MCWAVGDAGDVGNVGDTGDDGAVGNVSDAGDVDDAGDMPSILPLISNTSHATILRHCQLQRRSLLKKNNHILQRCPQPKLACCLFVLP